MRTNGHVPNQNWVRLYSLELIYSLELNPLRRWCGTQIPGRILDRYRGFGKVLQRFARSEEGILF